MRRNRKTLCYGRDKQPALLLAELVRHSRTRWRAATTLVRQTSANPNQQQESNTSMRILTSIHSRHWSLFIFGLPRQTRRWGRYKLKSDYPAQPRLLIGVISAAAGTAAHQIQLLVSATISANHRGSGREPNRQCQAAQRGMGRRRVPSSARWLSAESRRSRSWQPTPFHHRQSLHVRGDQS